MPRISKDQLLKLQKKYATDDSIGQLFGITRQAVQQLRKRYGLRPVEDKYNERNAEIVSLYVKGVSCMKLAQKFKLSLAQIYRVIGRADAIKKK